MPARTKLASPPGRWASACLRFARTDTDAASLRSASGQIDTIDRVISKAAIRRTSVAVLMGAVTGAAVALWTPAHLEIAGSDALIRVHPGRAYDQIALSSSVLVGTRATSREVLGEPVGVSVDLDLDPSTFVAKDGSFNSDIVPAYVQAYSDPHQLAVDLRWALTKHFLSWVAVGAGAALVVLCATGLHRRSRERRVRHLRPVERAAVDAVLAHTSLLRRRAVLGVAVVAVFGLIPAGHRAVQPARVITPNPLLADTPFAGAQVGGLLRPALVAIRDYIDKYIAQTDTYYDQLRDKMLAAIDRDNLEVPSDPGITNLVFVTDRHCNIGMDRVIVALADRFNIDLLVSAGDDAFSGSFPFESACTKNLAAKSQQAGMTDVFSSGNHDSATTRSDETDQHINVLDGAPVTVNGLTFMGLPDPRTSRYGQGIRPSSDSAQQRVLTVQGRSAGRVACGLAGPVIAVLHDPLAGRQAIPHGCGRVTVALDGHTHRQIGPTASGTAANGVGVYQYVGASTGGAPGEGAIERTFASRLTVGPLNHDASISIVSIDQATGALVSVTVAHFTPEQEVTFETLRTG